MATELDAAVDRLVAELSDNPSLMDSLHVMVDANVAQLEDLKSKVPATTAAKIDEIIASVRTNEERVLAAIVKGTPAATVPDNPPPVEPTA